MQIKLPDDEDYLYDTTFMDFATANSTWSQEEKEYMKQDKAKKKPSSADMCKMVKKFRETNTESMLTNNQLNAMDCSKSTATGMGLDQLKKLVVEVDVHSLSRCVP